MDHGCGAVAERRRARSSGHGHRGSPGCSIALLDATSMVQRDHHVPSRRGCLRPSREGRPCASIVVRPLGGTMCSVNRSDPKADLHRYLQAARDALLWKLDGLSEYDIRRPMVPTGTNLLGLVKHVASVEAGLLRRHLRPAVRRAAAVVRRTTPSPTPTCGRPPRSRASRSSACTTGPGRTRTPRSTRWRWTRSATCRGGRTTGAR